MGEMIWCAVGRCCGRAGRSGTDAGDGTRVFGRDFVLRSHVMIQVLYFHRHLQHFLDMELDKENPSNHPEFLINFL